MSTSKAGSGAHPGDSRFTGGKLFERVFADGMALVEETAGFLDGEGREMSKTLPREASLTYAAWSMDLTTRLMQAASWLVMQKAVRDGEMARQDALADKYRMVREGPALDAEAQRDSGLPSHFLDLVARAEALFDQICRLDESLYGGEAPGVAGHNPVNEQIERLREAAETGTFDPLSVWRGTK
jgi:regulator of CtrA degradation